MGDLLINGKGSEDRFKLLSEATFEGICIHDQGMTRDAVKGGVKLRRMAL